MTIKILGGIARGHGLQVPKGDLIRPTSVMLKRRIFDSFQNMSDYIFIDCCAGTGAMGLEAWSRGAQQVFLIEKNKKCYGILKRNFELIRDRFPDDEKEREIFLFSQSIEKWLLHFEMEYQKWSSEKQEQTILFLDPPYELKNIYDEVMTKLLKDNKWFHGALWLESDEQKGYPEKYWLDRGPVYMKSFTQGKSYISIFNFSSSI